MKLLAFLFLISFSYILGAQQAIFVRVYDLKGNKINKGFVIAATNTELQLGKGLIIPVSKIGSIKTKHSVGNNLFFGSSIGAFTLGLMEMVNANAASQGDAFESSSGIQIVVGAIIGAAIGGISLKFKKSNTFLIDGDLIKWKAFQLIIKDRYKLK
ncbi:MAG: hypothetical protein EPO57_05750 [Chitinophagaceae bacterium]|nr:MAG: hypothetical protein EPO57_05750 [Chitinophagaceae bacterium]